ncbi:MAG: bifunctional phosphoribosylaminoimidazolecarboxamide formyltransferase/IMP cyclohydrolase [Candidatus Zixiibacteriota bacterium]
MESIIPKAALVSVYNKNHDVIEFAKKLLDYGIDIYASSGTYAYLKKSNIVSYPLEQITGFEKLLDGRVKTLHPNIYSAILGKEDDRKRELAFDIVAVDLYPFEDALKSGKPQNDLIEMVDIGGVALLRASAKNYHYVLSICGTSQLLKAADHMDENDGKILPEFSAKFARHSFQYTSYYDSLISAGLFTDEDEFPKYMSLPLKVGQKLRYGENPHQKAIYYKHSIPSLTGRMEKLWGKDLSYNNILDIDGAIHALAHLWGKIGVVVLKHTSPCGIGIGSNQVDAYEKALASDPLSAFGGVIGVNEKVGLELAKLILRFFVEVVVAPDFDEDALEIFKGKKNIRIVRMPDIGSYPEKIVRGVAGGCLVSDFDSPQEIPDFEVVSEKMPTDDQVCDLHFAWRAIKSVKSNSILIAKNGGTVGIGGGQPSRVDAAISAVRKAQDAAIGAVAASDAFLPFPDTLQVLADAGVTALIQPGGSRNDKLSIEMANKLGVVLVFTGMRHFRH